MSFSQEEIKLLMQNYALEELFYVFNSQERTLYEELLHHEKELHFPAVKADVGRLLTFFTQLTQPRTIFEFGSGYGHSSFWYLFAKTPKLNKVYLTEKRDDLESIFNGLSWPSGWKDKLCYLQGDAFESMNKIEEKFDLVLVDGMKAQYQEFMKTIHSKLSDNGLVIIDNSFWKGKFLDESQLHRKSPMAIAELHKWLKTQSLYELCFIPMSDGLFLLKKKI